MYPGNYCDIHSRSFALLFVSLAWSKFKSMLSYAGRLTQIFSYILKTHVSPVDLWKAGSPGTRVFTVLLPPVLGTLDPFDRSWIFTEEKWIRRVNVFGVHVCSSLEIHPQSAPHFSFPLLVTSFIQLLYGSYILPNFTQFPSLWLYSVLTTG